MRELLAGAQPGQYDAAIGQAMDILREPAETDAMKQLRDEAGKLGEASNQLHGDRNLGYFKLDAPFRNLSGEMELLEQAKSAKPAEEKKSLLDSVIELTNKKTSPGRRG